MSLIELGFTSLFPDLLPTDLAPSSTGINVVRTRRMNWRIVVGIAYLSVFLLARFWLSQVTKYVPEPYLDEIFHIPQAQRYCNGDWTWDPKITTPPGLYGVSLLLQRLTPYNGCSIKGLRGVGSLGLLLLFYFAARSRNLVGKKFAGKDQQPADLRPSTLPSYAIHTAANICLFPPLFFFSGLYYTDVLSTCFVICAYSHFLARVNEPPTLNGGIEALLYGLAALSMRQTNIFWVAIFLAGLHWLRAVDINFTAPTPLQRKMSQLFNDVLGPRPTSPLLDPLLRFASITDVLSSIIRIGVEILANPLTFITYIWPYIALVVSFALFVLWNGGVVLGDKSNHVAVIHLPQLLYLCPFMAFFSLPAIYPFALAVVKGLTDGLLGKKDTNNTSSIAARCGVSISHIPYIVLATILSLVVVHFNTIIHPFTLADNRHYVFYVFRYSIRRHRLVKYTLAPIYVACGYLLYLCFGGMRPLQVQPSQALRAPPRSKSPKPIKPENTPRVYSPETLANGALFTSIWLITTALSLVTAPLVEPRYFIIPWLIWRLNLPPLPISTKESHSEKSKEWITFVKYWAYEGHDHRLWLETAWFLFINAVTGYIFLFRGFEWSSEPGRVQRFMW